MSSSTSTERQQQVSGGESLKQVPLHELLQRLAASEEALRAFRMRTPGGPDVHEHRAAQEMGAEISRELERRRLQRRQDESRPRSAAWPAPPW